MPIISCPQCHHAVSSVASVCPKCSQVLGQRFWEQIQRTDLIKCRKCRGLVAPEATVCRNCGVLAPTERRIRWIRMAVLGAAAAVGTLLIARTTSQATSEPFVEAPATIASETAAAKVAPPEEDDAPTPIAVAAVESPEPELAAASPSPPTVVLPEPATAPSQRPSGEVKWTNTWVNVRADRSIDAPVVLTIDPAKAVDVDDLNRGWWAAYVDGKHVGYVANSVLSDQRPTL
jgi:RNA polymerase subunit RPABC4/transcription elongation factor Spt4